MKITVLSRNRNLYSTGRILQAGEERGRNAFCSIMKCVLVIEQGRPHIYLNGRKYTM